MVNAVNAHLREWPLDLVSYSYQNSHRTDLNAAGNIVAITVEHARQHADILNFSFEQVAA